MAAAGWYPDPTGRFELRWFDGTTWSPSVSRAGQQFLDEVNAAPSPTAPTPAPGFGPPPGFGRTPIITESTEPVRRSANTGLIVGAIVAAVAIAAVGFVVALGGSDSDESPQIVADPIAVAVEPGDTTPDGNAAGDEGSQPVDITGEYLPTFSGDPFDAAGMVAPVVSGFDVNGDPITIDAAADGPYMLVFLAHWCPHCNREIPRLLEWQANGGVPAELKIVGVATAVSPDGPNYPPREWLAAKEWAWPTLLDQSTGNGDAGVAAQAYGASGWPYFVIVGADGLVKVRGAGEMAIEQLQSMVDDALAS